MMDFVNFEVDWIVQGQRAAVAWLDRKLGSEKRIIGLVEGDGTTDGARPGQDTSLWIGHEVGNTSRMVVAINVPVKTRCSTSKRQRDFFLVLPLAHAAIEVSSPFQPPAAPNSNHVLSSTNHVFRVAFSLNVVPYVVMPLPRNRPQKPLDDTAGYLVLCLRSLTSVKHIELQVSAGAEVDKALGRVAVAAASPDVELDLPVAIGRPDEFGEPRAVNAWYMYPITADELAEAPVDVEPPPAYPNYQSSPDEQLYWCVASPPKRKASSDPPSPPRGRLCKERLDEASVTSTVPAGTAEILEWAKQHAQAAPPRAPASADCLDARSDATRSTAANPASVAISWRYHGDVKTFSCSSLRAPSVSTPVTSTWRMEFTKPNAIFFDLVALLQKALRHDSRVHETHMESFLILGYYARKAVASLDERPGVLVTTPEQDSYFDIFTNERHRLLRTIIADAAKAPSSVIDWTKNMVNDPRPFPRDPAKQVEYVRSWINEHLQLNADLDVVDELIEMQQAAARLAEHSPFVVCAVDDPVLVEFEYARAACLAAAFFRLGGHTLMRGREEQTPTFL